MNVPINDTGTVSKGINVARQFCRKTNTTINTSTIASTNVCKISSMPALMGSDVSSVIWYSRSAGKRRLASSMTLRIFSTVANAFVPGIWYTTIVAAGLPLSRLIWLYNCTPRSTRATSFSSTCEPSALERTTMFSKSSALSKRPCVRTVYVNSVPAAAGGPPICPAGDNWFCAFTAFTRSGTVKPSLAIRSGFTQIRIA